MVLVLSINLWGQFDFGECSGTGSFEQQIEHYAGDYESAVLVGTIPEGIQGLRVELTSDMDVDIRLYGQNDDKIVHWPYGILHLSYEQTDTYQGVSVTYSGYNGVNGQKGHEFIEVSGSTPTSMTMKAFGYRAGYANVNYSWTGKDNCNGSENGRGHFEQEISHEAISLVGTIPPYIDNLEINLTSETDIDIQLYGEDGTAIVKWPAGLLNGARVQEIHYHGMHIEWSGYNGLGGEQGHEYIRIYGLTTETLTMKVYGYQAGFADVDYSWGNGENNDSDTEAPIITLVGETNVTVNIGQMYVDAEATAYDNKDGDISANIVTVNHVNTNVIGDYRVTYDVTDNAGNEAMQVVRTVHVVDELDTTIPIITLLGDENVTVYQGEMYVDAGANALDNKDGDISANIQTVNNVNTNVIGVYTVTYNVSDNAGNSALQVTRMVRVIEVPDTTIPIITLLGEDNLTIYQNENYVGNAVAMSYVDAGAIASDNKDGDITSSIVMVNPVDVSTLGTYIVTFDVNDSAGNSALQVTRTVNVVEVPDTTPPVITLSGDENVTVYQGEMYVDAGANALDNKDGDISENIVTVNNVNTNILGIYTLTYNVSDNAGNSALQVTRMVNVVEETQEVTTVQLPLLIIRIEFNDYSFENSANTWHNKIFGTSDKELNDYINEISYGKFQFVPANEIDDVADDGIITVHLDENHPNTSNDVSSFLSRLNSAIALANDFIDFSEYDTNNNNAIASDELQIMYLVAGGESATGTSPGQWAHAWCMYGGNEDAPTHDGVSLMNCYANGNYSLFGEKHGVNDASIGIIAHELGHATFDLPDLYDTDGSSSGIGNFGLMGSGSWGYKNGDSQSGQTPTHMTGWSKIQSGFLEATTINDSVTDLNLHATASSDYVLYKIRTNSVGEYFLIENRAASGYDMGLTSLSGTSNFSGGLSILHIDDNIGNNDDENHKLVDVEEANNAGLDTKTDRGHINNLYFNGNSNSFNASTSPSSNRYDTMISGVSIENISDSATVMTADINVN
ncbi:MAG: Unknown protein [uncultured Sulfurovum sp.]|uniref:Pesticidal crystal protein Cry22Aa Ig-like domain-containing protein n=1 Tax=uncultured Sulfurovum sp. TaxID=269237 RepID=A0A6S6SC88_9BACT|nr:MAG: Unknown protein [uncultured Sulfurovum sp.]